jgi:hypothetical protein
MMKKSFGNWEIDKKYVTRNWKKESVEVQHENNVATSF